MTFSMARVTQARCLRASRRDEHSHLTDPDESNRVGLTRGIPDMDAVMAMMQTQEGADDGA
jgi:hypothetical protein